MSGAGQVLSHLLHCHSLAVPEESLAMLPGVWEGTECSSLPKEMQLRASAPSRAFPALENGAQGSPRTAARPWHPGAGQAQPPPSGAERGAPPGLLRTAEPALPWGMLRVTEINKGVDVICSSVSCSICQVNLLSGADPVVPPLLCVCANEGRLPTETQGSC